MCTAFGDRLPAKSSEPSATTTSASSLGRESQHHITGGKLGELPGSASSGQRRCLRRISVIDQHPITVFYEVDGKSVSHMAETDPTGTFGDEWGQIPVAQPLTRPVERYHRSTEASAISLAREERNLTFGTGKPSSNAPRKN
jgi:hypothetical protein